MTFMVKEILDYTSTKTSEGELIVSIKYAKTMINVLNDKVKRFKAL